MTIQIYRARQFCKSTERMRTTLLAFLISMSLLDDALAQEGQPGEHGPCVLSGTYNGLQARPRFNGRPIYRETFASGNIRWRLYCTTVTVPVGATAEFKSVSDAVIYATGDVEINGALLNVGEPGRNGQNGGARKGGDGGDGGRGAGGRGLQGQGGASGYGCDLNGLRGLPGPGTESQGQPDFSDTDGRTIPCLRAVGGGAAGGTGGTKGAVGAGYWTSSSGGQIGKYFAREPWVTRSAGFDPRYTWDNSAGGGSGAGGGCRATDEAEAGGGGGGGGAGGAILIMSSQGIRISSSGAIRTNGAAGGDGGNGADSPSSQRGGSGGGGGAGGAGGLIYLRGQTISIDSSARLEANGGGGGSKGQRGLNCFNPEDPTACDGADGPGGGGGKITVIATQAGGLPSDDIIPSQPDIGQDSVGRSGGRPTRYKAYEHLECRGSVCRKTVGAGDDQCSLAQEDLPCTP